jgi:hypothetical protein
VLRALVLLLVLANLVFFLFTRGTFDGMFGLSSVGDREPERLASQVRPKSVVLMPMRTASAAPGAGVPGGCLEAGPIAASDAAAAEGILRIVLGQGGWVDERSETVLGGTPVVTHTYRVASTDAATAARLVALKLDAAGRGFSACAKTSETTR